MASATVLRACAVALALATMDVASPSAWFSRSVRAPYVNDMLLIAIEVHVTYNPSETMKGLEAHKQDTSVHILTALASKDRRVPSSFVETYL